MVQEKTMRYRQALQLPKTHAQRRIRALESICEAHAQATIQEENATTYHIGPMRIKHEARAPRYPMLGRQDITITYNPTSPASRKAQEFIKALREHLAQDKQY